MLLHAELASTVICSKRVLCGKWEVVVTSGDVVVNSASAALSKDLF